MQRADAWNAEVAVDRYLARCRLKTAVLFRAACELGALEGNGARQTLASFGEQIGLAFQILDDVLDVTGPPERTGKARGTDLLDGTVTLPLILAMQRDPELAKVELRGIDQAEAERICDRIAATGALDEVRAHALDMVAAAKRDVAGGTFDEEQQELLEIVADGVVERYG
jgi:geranylgeranyl pyrophosphate synthase